jgi:hypothetical protein
VPARCLIEDFGHRGERRLGVLSILAIGQGVFEVTVLAAPVDDIANGAMVVPCHRAVAGPRDDALLIRVDLEARRVRRLLLAFADTLHTVRRAKHVVDRDLVLHAFEKRPTEEADDREKHDGPNPFRCIFHRVIAATACGLDWADLPARCVRRSLPRLRMRPRCSQTIACFAQLRRRS